MNMFTQNPTTVCLEQDDLDGLNVLYPTCEDTVTVPQCYKAQQYLGWVRLLVVVGGPLLLILLAVLVCHSATMHAHERNRAKLRGNHAGLTSDLEAKVLERRKQMKQAQRGRRVMNAVKGIKHAHIVHAAQQHEEERLNAGGTDSAAPHTLRTTATRDGGVRKAEAEASDAERLRAYTKALSVSSSVAVLAAPHGGIQLPSLGVPPAIRADLTNRAVHGRTAPPLPPITPHYAAFPAGEPFVGSDPRSLPAAARGGPANARGSTADGRGGTADGSGFALESGRLLPVTPQQQRVGVEMQPGARRPAPRMLQAPAGGV